MNNLSNLEQFVLASTREELRRELLTLRKILPDSNLENIILSPFMQILESDRTSLYRLYYMKELSSCLQQLSPGCTAEQVDQVLVYMNFNSRNYVRYKLQQLSDTIGVIPSVQQQLTKTKWLLKMNKQQQENIGFVFNRNYASLKVQISEWLTLESEYLEHKVRDPENIELAEDVAKWRHFKVKMKLSFSELAFLLRVMMEHGVILHSNKSEVVDFFARYFSSVNQPVISAESLRKKMYDSSTAGAESVRKLFYELFQRCKRMMEM
ncbi:hypothetical protein [Chitinophaga sp.]|uniref:hypothetical protein n=1 Tax=Chitinophaga sp. TaxID=1869181 RepID=UPI0031D59743